MTKLISLQQYIDDHTQQAKKKPEWSFSGIACPDCGKELEIRNFYCINPNQGCGRKLRCTSCSYEGGVSI